MPFKSKRGSKTTGTLLQQHVFMEAIDPSVQTFQFEVACTPIVVQNVYTRLSGVVSYNVNGVTGTVQPGQSFTYTGAAVDTLTLNTTGKIATVCIIGTEVGTPMSLTYYEMLINGGFDRDASGWTLIDGTWGSGRINLNAVASFRAAGYQLVTVAQNTTYTLSHDGTGLTAVYDATGSTVILDYGAGSRTFNSGANGFLRVYMGNGTLPAGSYWFDNLSLKRFI